MEERPLVITEDEELLDELLRLGAAAGIELTCARTPENRDQWRAAGAVLIDAAQVAVAVRMKRPRRTGVYAVVLGEPEPGVWENCLRLGVEDILRLPAQAELVVEVLSNAQERSPGNGRAVAVIGARGGAGASVLAAALAMTAARGGAPVILADCDPWGSGLDVLLGLEAGRGLRWPDLLAPAGRVGVDALHRALPSVGDLRPIRAEPGTGAERRSDFGGGGRGGRGRLSVLTHDPLRPGPIPAAAVEVVVTSCRRAGELVVLDLPRTPTEATEHLLELTDLVVLVAAADVGSCTAGRRLLPRLRAGGATTGLVVRGPSPGSLGADDVAACLELPLIAAMRPQPGLARDLEWGRAPCAVGNGPLISAAHRVLELAGVHRTTASERGVRK